MVTGSRQSHLQRVMKNILLFYSFYGIKWLLILYVFRCDNKLGYELLFCLVFSEQSSGHPPSKITLSPSKSDFESAVHCLVNGFKKILTEVLVL